MEESWIGQTISWDLFNLECTHKKSAVQIHRFLKQGHVQNSLKIELSILSGKCLAMKCLLIDCITWLNVCCAKLLIDPVLYDNDTFGHTFIFFRSLRDAFSGHK